MDTKIIDLLLGNTQVSSWTNLELQPLKDGGGADTGGVNKLAHGTYTNTDGLIIFHPVKRPAGQPWDNLYIYGSNQQSAPLTYVAWEVDFDFLPSDMHGNAREFEVEPCEAGKTYNMAWQYKWSNVDGPPAIRMFDQIAQGWKTTKTKLPTPSFVSGKATQFKALFSINREAETTTHEAIMIDGNMFYIGETHPAKQKWSPTTNYFHHAAQIDSLGDGQPCTVRLKNWNIRGL